MRAPNATTNHKSILSRPVNEAARSSQPGAGPRQCERQVPDPEVIVPLTKTTIRALAASIALVAAGATVAGAAVFQLPILGFAQARPCRAAVSPGGTHVVTRPAAPVKIVRTRYVDDIVHRPAPATAYPAVRVVAATAPPPRRWSPRSRCLPRLRRAVGAQPRQSPGPPSATVRNRNTEKATTPYPAPAAPLRRR